MEASESALEVVSFVAEVMPFVELAVVVVDAPAAIEKPTGRNEAYRSVIG